MKKTSNQGLAQLLGISKSRANEAVIKTKIISAIQKELQTQKITQTELANATKIPRSAITGILSGSLQKITIDRLLRILDALHLTAEIKIKKAA